MVTSNPNQNDLNLDGQKAADGVTKAWTQLLGTTSVNGGDWPYALTTGSDGSIYIAGYTWGDLDGETNSGSRDAYLTKYDPDGTKDWTQLLGTTSYDEANALTTGSDGSIYIAGFTQGDLDGETNSGSSDAFLTKYDSDGTKDWTKLLGTTSGAEANALTTGSDGSIYIAGKTSGDLDGETNSGSSDAFLTKYNVDGTKDWTQLLGTNGVDGAHALTTGSDGSIYIAGLTTGDLDGETNNGGNDAFLTKYDPDGTKDWTRLLGSTKINDKVNALTTGSDGSIYIAGRTPGDLDGKPNSGDDDAFLTKYKTDGTKGWTQLLGTPSHDAAYALITGSDGSIYIAGVTAGDLDGETNKGGSDAFLTKYDPDGTKDWTQLLGTTSTEIARALTTGSDGSIYIAGLTRGDLDGEANKGGGDAFLTKFVDQSISITPIPNFSVTTSTNSLNEGETLTTNIETTDLSQGSEVFWALEGENITQKDLRNGQIKGSYEFTVEEKSIIASTDISFAALKGDGSVVTWGYADILSDQLDEGVVNIYSNSTAFAALKENGSVVTWGGSNYHPISGEYIGMNSANGRYGAVAQHYNTSTDVGAQLQSGVKEIFSTDISFAALKDDGSVVTWGYADILSDQLDEGVVNIYSNSTAFAALKENGSVVTWGGSNYHPISGEYIGMNSANGRYGAVAQHYNTSTDVGAQLQSGVKEIFSTDISFAALKDDGSVVTWGYADILSDQLDEGVVNIYSNSTAFAALKENGSVVTWGGSNDHPISGEYIGMNSANGRYGAVAQHYNTSTDVGAQLQSGVKEIFSTDISFAALKDDGSVVTWGYADILSDQLDEGVVNIYSNSTAFAALKENGSVVTWGGSNYHPISGEYIGMNSANGRYGAVAQHYNTSTDVGAQLQSGVKEIFSTDISFAALKDDGSVVTWGYADILSDQLDEGVVNIYSNSTAFAALKENGSVVTWGGSNYHPISGEYIGMNSANGRYGAVAQHYNTSTDVGAQLQSGFAIGQTEDNFSLSHSFAQDLTTEGLESLIVKLFSDQARQQLVAQSAAVDINDTSTFPQGGDKLEISYELRKAKRKDGSSSTETDGIALETDVDTTIREDPLKSTAIKGIGATDNDAYILDILAKNVAQGYTLESTDITLKFNTDLFGSIDKDQIQLSSLFPVANAIHIDNTKGEIRIAGAGLNHISGAGAGIASGENKVFASIALNFDETALAKYTTGSATAGKLLTYDGTASGVDAFDGTLEFDLSVNRDSTVFSKSITETSGLENAEISTLRDLDGSVKAIKDSIALYEGQVDLSQTGDLTFASNRTIGVASGGIKTNLIRAGSTVYSDVTWKNTGNVAATDITIKNLATDPTAVGKVISSKSGFLKTATTTSTDYSKNGILDQTALDQIDATNNKLKGGSFVTTSAEEVNGLKIGDYDPNKQEEKTVRIAVEIGDDQAGKVFNAGKNLYRMEVIRKDQHGKDQTDEYDVGTNVGSKNLITFQGDLNFDGTVGMKDLAFLNAGAARQTLKDVTSGMKDNLGNDIGTQTKQAEANTYASDVDADFNGVIDIADLKILDKDWGKTLHTGEEAFHGISNGTTVGDNQISWADLNGQTGINESWDNTSFEKQNTLEAKASSGGYDAPLEHVQNANTSNTNIDSDNATRSDVVTGGTNNPAPSVSGGGGNYTEDITGIGLNDDIMGGSST